MSSRIDKTVKLLRTRHEVAMKVFRQTQFWEWFFTVYYLVLGGLVTLGVIVFIGVMVCATLKR